MTVAGTPAPWFGGKWEMDWILAHFPPHDTIHTYVEPFGGMAGLLLHKRPSPVEVYNDLSSGLVTFWRAVREFPDELARAVEATPTSYEEWYRAGAVMRDLKEPVDNDPKAIVETARQFVVMARQSMAGAPGRAYQAVITHSRRGMASNASAWLNMPEIIADCGRRFAQVQVEHRPAIFVLRKYDTPRTLFYVDPPYYPETCQVGIYKQGGGCEMSQGEHAALIRCLRQLEGSVILSGYDNPLYEKWLVDRDGWIKHREVVPCRSAVTPSGSVATRDTRDEILWVKYADGMRPDQHRSLFDGA